METEERLQNMSFPIDHDNISNRNITSEFDSSLISLTIPAVMFSSGVFGNILALAVLCRSSKEQKRSVFYRLVGFLAVADLFGILATSPVVMVVYRNNLQWVGGQEMCDYFSFMMIFAGDITVFIVGVMALDRYIAIKHPYFYSAHVSTKKVPYAIGIVLILAFVIACLPLMGLGKNVHHYPGTWCFFSFTSTRVQDRVFAYFYAILGLFVILMTAVLNMNVVLVLLKMQRKAKTLRLSRNSQNQQKRGEVQMMVLLIGIMLVFAVCWAPLMVQIILNQLGLVPDDGKADLMVVRLSSFNQILDPWVYLLFRKELVVKLVNMVKRVLCSYKEKQRQKARRNSSTKRLTSISTPSTIDTVFWKDNSVRRTSVDQNV